MSTARRRAIWAGIFSRDSAIFAGGWYLILQQAHAANFRPMVFVGGILIALAPGALAAWALRQLPGGQPPIEPASLPPAPEPLSPPL